MSKISITLPEDMHTQIIKIAGKKKESISYTTTKLIEIGLRVLDSQNTPKDEPKPTKLEEYWQMLIFQASGILKKLAMTRFDFTDEEIAEIIDDTKLKFNKLKDEK